MSEDILKRLRTETLYTSGGEQADLPETAADEIERLRAELAALRENSLAVLTRVRAYRDKVITERDTLRNLLWEAREQLWLHGPDTLCARIDTALNKGGGGE